MTIVTAETLEIFDSAARTAAYRIATRRNVQRFVKDIIQQSHVEFLTLQGDHEGFAAFCERLNQSPVRAALSLVQKAADLVQREIGFARAPKHRASSLTADVDLVQEGNDPFEAAALRDAVEHAITKVPAENLACMIAAQPPETIQELAMLSRVPAAFIARESASRETENENFRQRLSRLRKKAISALALIVFLTSTRLIMHSIRIDGHFTMETKAQLKTPDMAKPTAAPSNQHPLVVASLQVRAMRRSFQEGDYSLRLASLQVHASYFLYDGSLQV